MKLINRRTGWISLFLASLSLAAASLLPTTVDQQIAGSDAVFRGTVMGTQAFRDPADGFIYTRTLLRVEETFKGRLPGQLELTHRGGVWGGMGEWDSQAPQFRKNEEHVLFVRADKAGKIFATDGVGGVFKLARAGLAAEPTSPGSSVLRELRARAGIAALPGADLTGQAAAWDLTDPGTAYEPPPQFGFSSATNLMEGSDGLSPRSVLPDRGQPIPYYIDMDALPAGMTQSQAVYAVNTALAAWTNASSARFVYAGTQSFGMASANVSVSDGALRIQLHDLYNYVNGGNELGVGGLAWSIPQSPSAGWTSGGNVAGNDFHRGTRSFIVMESTATSLRNLSTFIEVLTHEVGHTLGLSHSSENQFESNPLFKQAIMYYLVHADGRGATLNNFDLNVVAQVHPKNNTPPWSYDRMMDAVTSPFGVAAVGVNTVKLRGYDLQGDNLTLETSDQTLLNGSFQALGDEVLYTPDAYFSATSRLDPAGTSYRDLFYARFSDGVNASPFIRVRVLSYSPDAYGEGIPDAWRTTYFGSANPNTGVNRHADEDFDGDGFSNLVEYWLGSDPASKASNLRISSISRTNLTWTAKAYELYEVLNSPDLVNWTRTLPPVVPTTSTGSVAITTAGQAQFFRVEKVH